MVIEFPTVDLGGAPSTEEAAPDGGAAFSSLVEGLLAEESASPEDVETNPADPNDPALFDAAVLFVVPPPVVNVPPPNGWLSGEATPDSLGQIADSAGAESVGSAVPVPTADPANLHTAELGASTEVATGRSVPTPASLLPAAPSRLVSHEPVSATPAAWPTSPVSPASGVDTSATSMPGAAVPEPPFAAPSTVPAIGDVVEGEAQVPTSAPTANTEHVAASEARPTGPVDASQSDRTARKDARGYFEWSSASAADAVPAAADAVQRASALVELGLDLGSPGGEGSREGGTSTSGHGAVPVVLAPTAGTSTAAGAAQATWMPASQTDDVVLPQLVRAMRLQLVGGVGEARIQLEPEHLGAVTVNLRVEGGVVSAVVTAEQSAVRQWIENHETSLRQALAEQGLVLGKLHVERDGRPPGERSPHGQDDTPRRRSPRKDTATFELLA